MSFMPFTNTWLGPARQGQGGYKARSIPVDSSGNPIPGTSTAPDATVVSAVIPFPDGSRSVAGVYRKGFFLPSNWPTNGWRPVYTNYGAPGSKYANWGSYMPGPQTAAYFDSLMGKGYIFFFLDSSLGNLGDKSGNNWAPGWYAHPLQGVWPEDVANFTWGMQQLNATASQGAGVQALPGMPNAQPMPLQNGGGGMVSPPPSRLPTILKVVAAVAVVGVVVWAVE